MKVLRHGKFVEITEGNAMGEKIVWDGDAFADLAARLKEVEGRLDKLERPWAAARAQRQQERYGKPPVTAEMLDDAAMLRKLTEELSERFVSATNIAVERKETTAEMMLPTIRSMPRESVDGMLATARVEIVRLEQSREELRLHIEARDQKNERLQRAVDEVQERNRNLDATLQQMRARILDVERHNSDLQASNNRMLERLRTGAAQFNDMLGRG